MYIYTYSWLLVIDILHYHCLNKTYRLSVKYYITSNYTKDPSFFVARDKLTYISSIIHLKQLVSLEITAFQNSLFMS